MPYRSMVVYVRTFVLAQLFCQVVHAGSWAQFRGPNGAGIAVGSRPLPDDLSSGDVLRWQSELAPGRSSPVVAGGRIFLTGVRDERPVTMAVDAETGELLWERPAPGPSIGSLAIGGGHAQSTCAANEEYVVSFFGTAGLVCYDREGQQVWQNNLGPFNTQFGVGSSPILVDGRVILCQDFDSDSFVAAIDLKTGDKIWYVDRPDFIANFATPMVWDNDGNRQVVVAGSLFVIGYDFETGEQVWSVAGVSWSVISTPIAGPDGTLYVNATAPGEDEGAIALPEFDESLRSSDRNGNGRLSRDEWADFGPREGFFPTLDRNKDGEIEREEYDYVDHLWDASRDALLAIQPGGRGDITGSHIVWTYQRSLPNSPSPLLYDGHLYLIKKGGIFSSLDARSGKPIKQGRVSGRKEYYSSPVVGDEKIYLANEIGQVTVVRAAAKWKELSSTKFDDEIYATPAIVDGRIYLRTTGRLYCFGYQDIAAEQLRRESATPAAVWWSVGVTGLLVLSVAVYGSMRLLFRRAAQQE